MRARSVDFGAKATMNIAFPDHLSLVALNTGDE
jgi:hypothetical protein